MIDSAMNAIKIFFWGLTSIFRGDHTEEEDPQITRIRKDLENYTSISDRERLAGDWQAVQRDMGKAWKKITSPTAHTE